MTLNVRWVEAWIDSASGEYVLLLREIADGKFQIVDPQKNMQIVMTFASYDDAIHWLNEDEYDLIEGRYSFE